MTTPVEHYTVNISIIAERLRLLATLPAEDTYLNAEHHALHVRKIVEGIAFASLSVFEDHHGVAHNLRTKDADKLLRFLHARGDLHLPVAFDLRFTANSPQSMVEEVRARNLGVDDLKRAFHRASEILHERHPERLQHDGLRAMMGDIRGHAERLRGWLWTHVTVHRGKGFLVQMALLGVPGFIAPIAKIPAV